jgi:hypothetical protein
VQLDLNCSDVGAFDSDSQTFDRVDYKTEGNSNGMAIDFSELRSKESEKDEDTIINTNGIDTR